MEQGLMHRQNSMTARLQQRTGFPRTRAFSLSTISWLSGPREAASEATGPRTHERRILTEHP